MLEAKISGDLFGLLENQYYLSKKLLWLLFRQILERIGQLLISSSCRRPKMNVHTFTNAVLLPKALKSCPKSKISPNLVTLTIEHLSNGEFSTLDSSTLLHKNNNIFLVSYNLNKWYLSPVVQQFFPPPLWWLFFFQHSERILNVLPKKPYRVGAMKGQTFGHSLKAHQD